MTLTELLAEFRRIADDETPPYLWAEDALIAYANEAQKEACRRAPLLVDTVTPAVCEVAIAAGQALALLDPRILWVRRARLAGQPGPLPLVAWRRLEETRPGWEDDAGTPTAALPDWQSGALRLYPVPTAPLTLRLAVQRLPLQPLAALGDRPEIPERDHRGLVHWMLALAYSKHDSEVFDPEAVAFYQAQFAGQFGPAPEAGAEARRARDPARTRYLAER